MGYVFEDEEEISLEALSCVDDLVVFADFVLFLDFVVLVELLDPLRTYHFYHSNEIRMSKSFEDLNLPNHRRRHAPVASVVNPDLFHGDNLVSVFAPGTIDLPVRALTNLLNPLIVSNGPSHTSPIALGSRGGGGVGLMRMLLLR